METFDDVPLVRIQDEMDELKEFLSSVYDSRKLHMEKGHYPKLSIMRNVLLLTDTYQVDHLWESIITVLEDEWPTSLQDWDIRESAFTILQAEKIEFMWEKGYMDGDLPAA
ncbi:hypothetical protein M422DRAFT_68036 [Sphaerobolus stellatus SS14]|uniref:Uncharacterized protein n=1 Tax=Sphaerobolus stellatus (strain SS14) TaxID=990650 RepID=A0A0C9UHD0_SPHS4|nr:hypothetical protein M422DRAFT_68036 [Sphaerobolus stellatus SS14]